MAKRREDKTPVASTSPVTVTVPASIIRPPPVPPPLDDVPDPVSLTIEGLTVPSGADSVIEPQDVSTPRVSIVQDSDDSNAAERIERYFSGGQPVIMSLVKFPNVSIDKFRDAVQVNQFERQIIKESVLSGVSAMADLDPDGAFTEAKDTRGNELKVLDERLDALTYMYDTSVRASTGLNIDLMSDQIMGRASDLLSEILKGSEVSVGQLPDSIDTYLSTVFPDGDITTNGGKYPTPTAKIVTLARDMMLAAISVHPSLLGSFTRESSSENSYFFTPGKVLYDRGTIESIPTQNITFEPVDTDLLSRFTSNIGGAGTPDRSGKDWKLINDTDDQARVWDSLSHLLCSLSNELIISAGIGKLVGTSLGDSFLFLDSENNRYFPFSRLLGVEPGIAQADLIKFYSSGPRYPNSFLDILALGEEAEAERFVVMPFETSTAKFDGKEYVAGNDYFIDLALQTTSDVQRSALKRFSTQYDSFSVTMSTYLTEILGLDKDTKLLPETILISILEDFAKALAEMQKEEPDYSVLYAAALCREAGQKPGQKPEINFFAAVLDALGDLDRLQTIGGDDTVLEYTLDRSKTTLDQGRKEFRRFKTLYENIGVRQFGLREGEERTGNEKDTYRLSGLKSVHDKSFGTRGNIVNSIATTIRELQKEARLFARQSGESVDYKNSVGGTYLSNCDDNKFVEIVTTIYTQLASLIFPIQVTSTGREEFGSLDALGDTDLGSFRAANTTVDKLATFSFRKESAIVSEKIVTSIINSISAGSDLDPDTVLGSFDESTRIMSTGDTFETLASDFVEFASRLPRHRFYIKSSLKILESIATSVAAASAGMNRLFDVLEGNVNTDDMNEQELVLYDMFVTNESKYAKVMENITPQQLSLNRAARFIHEADPSGGEIYLRRDLYLTKPERAALRVFVEDIVSDQHLDDLYIITAGAPSGLIRTIQKPITDLGINEGSRLPVASNIRISVDRYDEVYMPADGDTVVADIGNTINSRPFEFDPELFILPDSIQYDPSNPPPAAISKMDAVFRSTIFYRIRGGKIIEKLSGDTINGGTSVLYANCLKSYLLDLFMYETINIRHMDTLGPVDPMRLNTAGTKLFKSASRDADLSSLIMMKPGFFSLIDERTGQIKSNEFLLTQLTPRNVRTPPPFRPEDVKFLSVAMGASPLCESGDVIRYREFDRVFNILYDESIMREFIGGDDHERLLKRKQFDIFTLSLRIVQTGDI